MATPNTKTAASEPVSADVKAMDYADRARRARENRKLAPQVSVSGAMTVPQKEIIARFARDEGGQDGKFHYFFGDKDLSDRYADNGAEPVFHQGDHYNYLGDPMWKIPTDLHKQDLDAVVARSNTLLHANRTRQPSSNSSVQGESEVTVTRGDEVVLDTTRSP